MNILTDEQIEKLLEFELDRYCARALHELKNTVSTNQIYQIYCYSRNIKLAFELINYVESNGFWCQLKTPFDPTNGLNDYYCGFTPHGITGWNGRPDHFGSGSTMENAICKAFLRWHRDHKEGRLTLDTVKDY